MSQQARSRFTLVGRSNMTDTKVLEQGLARAFPLPTSDDFNDLITAIDLADERLRASKSRTTKGC